MHQRTNRWGAAVAALAVVVAGTQTLRAATELDEMVVVTRVTQSVRDIPAAVSVVTTSDVQRAAVTGIGELLQTVPGVDVQGSGYPGAITKPIMRGQAPGLQSKGALVLVDGRRVAEPFQSAVEFALFSADAVDHIEILRGPASALYGSDALSGVINIVSRRGTSTAFADLRVGYGSDDLYTVRGRQGWQVGDVDYFVTAGTVETDGYTQNADGSDRNWRARNFTANIGWAQAPGAELRFFTGYAGMEGSDDTSDRDIDKDYQHVVETWTWDDTRDATLVVRGYRNGDDQLYNWKFPGEGRYDMQTLGAELQQSIWFGEHHRVTAGGDVRTESVDSRDVAGPIDEESRVVGVYAQDEVHLGDAFLVTAGVRNDDDRDFGSELSPRVSALWRVTPEAELFGGYSRAHRAPSLSDRYFKGAFDNRIFEGNPDLQPETLTAYEVGGRMRAPHGVQLEVTAFYNDLDDAFEFAPDPDGVLRNRNVAGSKTYGVETGLRAALSDALDAFVTYTWTEGEYDTFPTKPDVEGNRLQYLANHYGSAGLAFDGGRLGYHAASVRVVGDRFTDDLNTSEAALDAYTVVNWRSRVPVGDHAVLTLNIDNLFDESHEEFYGIEQPGLTVIGGLELML